MSSVCRRPFRTLFVALAMLPAAAVGIAAQQADVIRGRVTDQTGAVIANARVTATSIPNNVSRNATTDKDGRYSIAFAGATGDYWIAVIALGFAPRRFE